MQMQKHVSDFRIINYVSFIYSSNVVASTYALQAVPWKIYCQQNETRQLQTQFAETK